MVGQKLSFADASQANVFKDMLLEIEVLGLNAEIEKVYFNDLDHLTLLARDAFSVSLGSSERLHAKLRSMSLVLEQLRSLKSPAGTVDVSIPESPTYIPEKTI